MEKNLKKIRTIAILLIVVLISLIAFVGLYVKEYGIWRNLLPEFNLGMELEGIRELHFVLDNEESEKEVYVDSEGNYAGEVLDNTDSSTQVSVETEGEETIEEQDTGTDIEGYTRETRTIKANEDVVLNQESYEQSKRIIQTRLEQAQVPEYNIRLDNITGNLILEVPENEMTDVAYELTLAQGKFEIIDGQTIVTYEGTATTEEGEVVEIDKQIIFDFVLTEDIQM